MSLVLMAVLAMLLLFVTAAPGSESFLQSPCPENAWRAPTTLREKVIIERLMVAARRFANHLKKKYPYSNFTRNLISRWNGQIRISATSTDGALFLPKTGCVVINPYMENDDDGDLFPRLMVRTLHELAHTTSGPHDKAFYDTQRFFLKVATEELGWKLMVKCRVCCHADTPCDQVCPKCTWLESPTEACKAPRVCQS